MAMPWQLAQAHRPKRGQSKRPIVELLPAVKITDIAIPSLYDHKTYILRNVSLKYPFLASLSFSNTCVEFQLPSLHRNQENPTQSFNLKRFKVGFGIRSAFLCTCGRPTYALYYLNRHIACRRCCNARHAIQTVNQHNRPILQASRIASFLDGKSRIFRRTRERLQKRLGEKLMTAQGKLGTDARRLWD